MAIHLPARGEALATARQGLNTVGPSNSTGFIDSDPSHDASERVDGGAMIDAVPGGGGRGTPVGGGSVTWRGT
jgi:hypothetical protein